MKNTEQMNPQELRIQGLIDRYLAVNAKKNGPVANQDLHLDDDSLAAFAEGNLSQRESGAVISHLVDCSFCRHITAELVRLDLAFASDEIVSRVENAEPSKISEVLSGLFSKIFGTSDGAVFAHNEADEEEKKDEEDKEPENK
jgi:hypothetical protein